MTELLATATVTAELPWGRRVRVQLAHAAASGLGAPGCWLEALAPHHVEGHLRTAAHNLMALPEPVTQGRDPKTEAIFFNDQISEVTSPLL